jgi:hypothetical protein
MYSNKIQIYFVLLLLGVTSKVMSQSVPNFSNIRFGDSLTNVQKEIEPISSSFKIVKNKIPNFPLAKGSEVHLIVDNVKLKTGKIDKIIFTFSDDKLNYIEVVGNIQQALLSNRKDTAQVFMNYSVYVKDLLFVNLKEDKAWILTKEAAHVGLFTWNNPLLIKPYELKTYNSSAKIPEFLKMGKLLEELLPEFKERVTITQLDTLNGSDPNAQFQINSYGIEYAGFPRKFEARFGDNKLNKIWILTGKEEEDRIRKMLIESYGEPIFINNDWEFFNDWMIGLRKDIPEVLFISKTLSEYYKNKFKQ